MIDKKSPKWLSVEKKILETAYALLNQEDSKVSVKSVCCLAGISRSSFYQHYHDIGHLLLRIRDDQAKMIYNLYSNRRIKEKEYIYVPLLEYAKNNKNIFINLLKRFDFEYFSEDVLNMIDIHISHLLNDKFENDECRRIRVMYCYTFIHSALSNCIVLWLNRGCLEEEKEFSKILYECSTTDHYLLFSKKYKRAL